MFRIAKLGRHNQNLNRLVRTIKGSAKEFSFLCLLFTVSMVIFSALGFELFLFIEELIQLLVYFAENEQNKDMDSIPVYGFHTSV